MKQIELLNTPHEFEKINSVTKLSNKGCYDELKCKKCGMKGRRYGISDFVTLIKNYSPNLIAHCTGKGLSPKADPFIGKFIRIIQCEAVGTQFQNLAPNSIHKIIKPPQNYLNGDRGVWVMGLKEPVKVLFNEFKYAMIRTKFNKNK